EVAIKSPSFEDNIRFAEDLIDESLELYDPVTDNYFFDRAEFRKETDVLKDNALYFATFGELQEITEYLQDEIQEAKEQANPFYIDFGEGEESGNDNDEEKLNQFEETYESIIPSEYPISEDST